MVVAFVVVVVTVDRRRGRRRGLVAAVVVVAVVVFAAVAVARAAGVDPEIAVRAAAARFRQRVEGAQRMQAEAGEHFESLGPEAQLEWYARFRARP